MGREHAGKGVPVSSSDFCRAVRGSGWVTARKAVSSSKSEKHEMMDYDCSSWQWIAGLGQLEIGLFSKAKAFDNKILNKSTAECPPFLGIRGDGTWEGE